MISSMDLMEMPIFQVLLKQINVSSLTFLLYPEFTSEKYIKNRIIGYFSANFGLALFAALLG